MSNNEQPFTKITLYPVTAAIWKNESAKGEPYYSFTLARSYKDDSGAYQTSGSYKRNDALLVQKVAELAFDKIIELENIDRSAGKSQE